MPALWSGNDAPAGTTGGSVRISVLGMHRVPGLPSDEEGIANAGWTAACLSYKSAGLPVAKHERS